MAKTKTPLLSLGAHGSIGKGLTLQKLRSETMVRTKPIPTDAMSDAQLRRRFFYKLICSYWNGLTAAQKQVWLTNARPYRITGFNLFMRTELAKIPYIKLYAPLDEGTGSVVKDWTTNKNNGAITGAAWLPYGDSKALYCDGTDDLVTHPDTPSLSALSPLSIEIKMKSNHLKVYEAILSKYWHATMREWLLGEAWSGVGTYKPRFVIYDQTTGKYIGAYADNFNLWDNVEHDIVCTWNGGTTWTSIAMYIDGVPKVLTDYPSDPPVTIKDTASSVYAGRQGNLNARDYYGWLLQYAVYQTVLSPADALLHHNRKELT